MRKDHVEDKQLGSHLQVKKEASGEIKTFDTLILAIQPPEL